MRFLTTTLVAIASILSLSSASPTSRLNSRTTPKEIKVLLKGAAGASYTAHVPIGKVYETCEDLSISSVYYDHEIAYCKFVGVDQITAPPTLANGDQVGPPQTIVSIYCQSFV